MKLKKTEKITNTRFLNLYHACYEGKNGKDVDWFFSSRRNEKDLDCNIKNKKIVDTVCVIPTIKKDGEFLIGVTKEFRYPINDYIYGFPAGCVENGEDPQKCAIRELKEEIGAEIKSITKLTDICYNSEGMTDENVIIYQAEVKTITNPQLEEEEDISLCWVKTSELKDFVKGKRCTVKLALYASFVGE